MKHTKRYIVTEEELKDLAANAFADGLIATETGKDLNFRKRSLQDCRLRTVPEWATHFAQDVEGPLDYGLYSLENEREIK
jgi:hypothetical protein